MLGTSASMSATNPSYGPKRVTFSKLGTVTPTGCESMANAVVAYSNNSAKKYAWASDVIAYGVNMKKLGTIYSLQPTTMLHIK